MCLGVDKFLSVGMVFHAADVVPIIKKDRAVGCDPSNAIAVVLKLVEIGEAFVVDGLRQIIQLSHELISCIFVDISVGDADQKDQTDQHSDERCGKDGQKDALLHSLTSIR